MPTGKFVPVPTFRGLNKVLIPPKGARVTDQYPIFPSLLAFDFSRLAEQVRALDAAGAGEP